MAATSKIRSERRKINQQLISFVTSTQERWKAEDDRWEDFKSTVQASVANHETRLHDMEVVVGKDEKSGLQKKWSDLKLTVCGDGEKRIGLVGNVRQLWDRWHVSIVVMGAIFALVVYLSAQHMVEVGTFLQK